MIIVQVCETIQPEIAKDHRVKIESDKVAEAKAGENEERCNKCKGRHDGNRHVPSRGIKEDMECGGIEGDRKSVIGNPNQRRAANDDVNTNQQAEPETFSSALMIGHTSVAIIRRNLSSKRDSSIAKGAQPASSRRKTRHVAFLT